MPRLLAFFLFACAFSPALADIPTSASFVTAAGFETAKQPQVTVAPDGTVDVVFAMGQAVYMVQSTDEGKTFTPPVKVADVPGLMVGMRRGPRIAASGKRILVTAPAKDLLSFISTDNGKTWTSGGPVNDKPGSAAEGLQNIASLDDGSFYAVWLDHREGSAQVEGARLEGDTWNKNVAVYHSPEKTVCECCHPSISSDDNGNIVVMWRNFLKGNRDLYHAESTDRGISFSPAQKLGTGSWPLNACPMDGGAVIKDSSGIYAVWQRAGGVFLTTPTIAERQIALGNQPVLARINGHTAVFWQDRDTLSFKSNVDDDQPELFKGYSPSMSSSPDAHHLYLVWEGEKGIQFSGGTLFQ